MQFYCESLKEYQRLITREVRIGDLLLGNPGNGVRHPIRVQTMTTTDTMDTMATVEQSIRCIEAGSELVRITAPSKREAENLLNIKSELRKRGYNTPLVADIHFTPNAAEIAARIVEKVRVNPGNYVDKKKFELIEYGDADYAEEIDRILGTIERFGDVMKDIILFYYPEDWEQGEIIWTPVKERIPVIENKYRSASTVFSSSIEVLSTCLHEQPICMILMLIDTSEDRLMGRVKETKGASGME